MKGAVICCNGDVMKKKRLTAAAAILFLCMLMGLLYHKEMETALTTMAYRPLSGITIVLDAGHGGKDNGAMISVVNERDINLSIIQKLKN